MATKILLTADLHCHNYKDLNSRVSLPQIFDVLDQGVEYCLENDIEKFWILGDLFHIRGKIIVPVFNKVHDKLVEITKRGISIGILSGNHDHVYNEDSGTSSIYTLQKIKGVEILDWQRTTIGKCDFLGIPYVYPQSRYPDTLVEHSFEATSSKHKKVLLTHGLLTGSVVGGGRTLTSKLDADAFDAFDLVFSGHVHHPQKLFGDKALMLGAPLCHDKKDLNCEDRGFWEFNCDTLETLFIPTTHPKFLSFVVASEKDIEKVFKKISQDDFAFITVSEKIENFNSIRKKYSSYKVDWEFSFNRGERAAARLATSSANTEEEIISDYIAKYGEDLSVSALNKYTTELLHEYRVLSSE